jgi:hypothetical protein
MMKLIDPPAHSAANTAPDQAAAVYRAVLPMNLCLNVGERIVSANGLFCALLEADGQLRVYRGAGPESGHGELWSSGRSGETGCYFALVQIDGNFCIYRGNGLSSNQGWHWGTQLTADGGQFHALLQDDGNFCICKGQQPAAYQGLVWDSGTTDPIARIDRVLGIAYDLGGATLVQARPSDLYRETIDNSSDQAQTSLISGSVTVSDTTGWSDELGPEVPAPRTYRGPVPVVSGSSVRMSADAGHAYLRNEAATTAKTWGFNAPAAVPPNSSMMCLVSAVRSSIVVPYTLTGHFTLSSGAQLAGTVSGSYRGANCHDLSVTLTTFDPSPAGNYIISRPLTPMPRVSGPTTAHPIGAADYY